MDKDGGSICDDRLAIYLSIRCCQVYLVRNLRLAHSRQFVINQPVGSGNPGGVREVGEAIERPNACPVSAV